MAEIFEFEGSRSPKNRQSAMRRAVEPSDLDGNAEIIIFPGVRYERAEPKRTKRKPRSKGRSKQK